jgi:peptidoglycan hydrolase-like protein with peptidoglycan-binding domain
MVAMKLLSAIALVLFVAVSGVSADDTMRAAQRKLSTMGFYEGTIDGQYGSQTAAAIRRYQLAQGLKVTGQLNTQTLESLGMVAGSTRGGRREFVPEYVAIASIFKGGPFITAPTELQIETIRQAQKTLKLLGYYHGPVDGSPSQSLVASLKAWQKSAGFRQTGRFDESTLKGLDIMPN